MQLIHGDCLEVMDKLITDGLACKNLGRNFIGIELDDKYFEIAKQRIENHKSSTKSPDGIDTVHQDSMVDLFN